MCSCPANNNWSLPILEASSFVFLLVVSLWTSGLMENWLDQRRLVCYTSCCRIWYHCSERRFLYNDNKGLVCSSYHWYLCGNSTWASGLVLIQLASFTRVCVCVWEGGHARTESWKRVKEWERRKEVALGRYTRVWTAALFLSNDTILLCSIVFSPISHISLIFSFNLCLTICQFRKWEEHLPSRIFKKKKDGQSI